MGVIKNYQSISALGHLNIVFKYKSQREEYEKNNNNCIIIYV